MKKNEAIESSGETVMFETPGVMSIGPYLPKVNYEVSREEAQRLCEAKGFKRVSSPAVQSIMEREE